MRFAYHLKIRRAGKSKSCITYLTYEVEQAGADLQKL